MAEQASPQEEQPIVNPDEVAQAAALEDRAPEPTSINIQTDDSEPRPEDEGRWDPDKAATLAAVLKEDEHFGRELDKHVQFKSALDTGEYENADKFVSKSQDTTDALKDEIEALEGVINDPDASSQDKEQAERAAENRRGSITFHEREIQGRKKEVRAEGQEKLTDSREQVTALSDRTLNSFEELYDLNPGVFATMPTSEFMEIGRKLSAAESKLRVWDAELRDTLADYIAKAIEDKKQLPFIGLLNDFDNVHDTLISNAEKLGSEDDMSEELKAIYEDTFDKTGREVMNEVKALADKYTARIEQERAAAQAARDEIINKYTPASDNKEA
ncbi:MAG: hypothetical protein QG553_498 [Patescibacteria group bacterium]|nr:hypothetical protein [Patescibacteria group bacterium]